MKIEIGFSALFDDLAPEISIAFNNEIIVNSDFLFTTGMVTSETNDLKYVSFNVKKQNLNKINILKINALNMHLLKQDNPKFGFCIEYLNIDLIDISYFTQKGKISCPIPNNNINSSYITDYLRPQNKMHELKTINNQLMHVRQGDYINFVDMPESYYEFEFGYPIYNWLFDMNFGDIFTN